MSSRRSLSLESVSSMQSIDTVQSIDSAGIHDDVPFMAGKKTSSNEQGVEVNPRKPASDGSVSSCEPIRTATAPASSPPLVVNKNESEQEPVKTKTHPRFFLDPRTVDFVLDDGTLYRVFRYFFDLHSPEFVANHLSNDSSDPIQLSGVSGVDFDRFLSLMYPSELAGCDIETPSEWISVLRLANKWSFPALRARAIKEIERIGSVVDKICVAREFGGLGHDDMHPPEDDLNALQQWLLPAFTEACTTPKWLASVSLDDAERLGAGTVLQVARIREESRDASAGKFDVVTAIVEAGMAPRKTKISIKAKPSISVPNPATSISQAMCAPLSGTVKPAPAVRTWGDLFERAFEGPVRAQPHASPINNILVSDDKPTPAAVPPVIASPNPAASGVRPRSARASDSATGPEEPSTITVSRTKWIDTLLALESYGILDAGLAPISESSMNPHKTSAATKDAPATRPSPSSSLEPGEDPVESAQFTESENPTASRAHLHELLTGEKPLSKSQMKKQLRAARSLEADRQAKYQR
ncbi:uncharacterized protein SCHCODRAFT_02616437 [Schizophyllum commune H4-8]|nr:uncharacterized protein SCHCODRAFT_02616437 [Schizophyllum commune H4-8]KAI5897006.1 hypothetical protein SCHCODRAFT_02616437 [Schizophyllum commune H4-8]